MSFAGPPAPPSVGHDSVEAQAIGSQAVRKKGIVSTWIVGAVVALILFLGAVSGGFGGALIFLAFAAFLTGLYVLITGRRSWARVFRSRLSGGITIIGSIVTLVVGATLLPPAVDTPAAVSAVVSPSSSAPPTQTSTPTPTPTPQTAVLSNFLGSTAEAASTSLEADGFTVRYNTDAGETDSAPGTWTVSNQSPSQGTRIPLGTTVTLSVSDPSPAPTQSATTAPAPVPVAPAPAPVAPAPAPVAPAPAPVAPAPVAPAPAPAPAAVTPGAFCPDASVGTTGVAANGNTYHCGLKGPDANGHYHWNAIG
jgi:hypothetical protein